ncbi:hypothetical protein HNY73_015088 [Argiope bruennichi]|uniref:Uncharacterized protein n=1 Tax=Argiope bruennichi TaxID=94029 RepID=A0A8T0ERJ3_ARGBR|nr:hypothetical protein HNY73_015088 [Argiope bruennichi]
MDLTQLKTQRKSYRTSFTVCAKKLEEELMKEVPELKKLAILKSQISDKFHRLEACQTKLTNRILELGDAETAYEENFLLAEEYRDTYSALCSLVEQMSLMEVEFLMNFIRQEVKGEEMINLARAGFGPQQGCRRRDNYRIHNEQLQPFESTTASELVSLQTQGRDGKIRTVKLKTQHGTVLRPIQRIYPLEIYSIQPTHKESTGEESNSNDVCHNQNKSASADDVIMRKYSSSGRCVKAHKKLNLLNNVCYVLETLLSLKGGGDVVKRSEM